MRILLTNDDGVHAPGLTVLEEIARTLSDDIWIVAPSEEQSGAGHSLTLTRPLRIRQHGESLGDHAGRLKQGERPPARDDGGRPFDEGCQA